MLPPLESESYVLSCAIRDPKYWPQVALIPEETFELPENRVIYRHLQKIHTDGLLPSLPLLLDRINESPEDSSEFPVDIDDHKELGHVHRLASEDYADIDKFESYFDPIRRKVQRDRVRDVAMSALQKLGDSDKDPDEITKWMGEQALGSHVRFAGGNVDVSIPGILKRKYTGRFTEFIDPSLENVGIHTGFRDLDKILLAKRPGQLVTIGARPGVGKTAFAMNLAVNAAKQGKSTLFYSMEMEDVELIRRLCSMFSGVNHSKFMSGDTDDDDKRVIRKAANIVSRLPIDIVDSVEGSAGDLLAKTQELYNIGNSYDMMVVDYMQLMSDPKSRENRNQEIGAISRGLKKMAQYFKIPIFNLSQLNRGQENQTNKRPSIHNLRDSGEIEQNSDDILFLYREDMYKEKKDDGTPLKEIEAQEGGVIAEVIVGKQRNGPTGSAKLLYQGGFFRFSDLEYYHEDG